MCQKPTFAGGRVLIEQQFDPDTGDALFSRHIPLCTCSVCTTTQNPQTPHGMLHELMANNARADAAEAAEQGHTPPISVFSDPKLDPRRGRNRPAKKKVAPWVRAAEGEISSEIVAAYS